MKSFILGFLFAILVVLLFRRVTSFYTVPPFPTNIEGITQVYMEEVAKLSKEVSDAKPEEAEKIAKELENSMEVLNNAYNMAVIAAGGRFAEEAAAAPAPNSA